MAFPVSPTLGLPALLRLPLVHLLRKMLMPLPVATAVMLPAPAPPALLFPVLTEPEVVQGWLTALFLWPAFAESPMWTCNVPCC